MWRARKPQQKTTNLCNEFIVVYLQRKKSQLQRTGMDRKALVYHTAICSIQKYPMPIICMQQLKTIYGVGELLADQLIRLIHIHYRAFLKPNQKNIMRQDGNLKAQSNRNLQQNGDDSNTGVRSNTVDKANQFQIDDTMSNNSYKSVNNTKNYKPRPKTLAAYMMMSIKKIAEQGYASLDMIKKSLKEDYGQKFTQKTLSLTTSNLTKQGYVSKTTQEGLQIGLTRKGLDQIDMLEAKTKTKQSQIKVKSIVSSFMSRPARQLKRDEQTQNKIKMTISVQQTAQLVLLIDNREIKDKQQQSFFQTRLKQKYNIESQSTNLPLGDFLWLYNGHILDYIVERKKADDLVSSIFDGRYKQQKYRLKNSGFTNIFYLFQGHLTGSNAKYDRQVHSALLNTRIRQKFKVIQVSSISQSAKFIHFVTQQISKKIKENKEIQVLGRFDEYANTLTKSSQLTVQHIFGLSLKTIPGVGSNSVSQILRYFGSFGALHKQLQWLNSREERIQFLKGILKGVGIRVTLPELLVDLLFGDD